MEQKRKKFGMEMLETLHKELKKRALDEELPLWAVTQKAVEEYLHKGGGKPLIEPAATVGAQYPPQHRKLFEMLDEVLRSGNDRAISMVTQSLEVFQEYVQVRGHGSQHQQSHPAVKTKKKRAGGRG